VGSEFLLSYVEKFKAAKLCHGSGGSLRIPPPLSGFDRGLVPVGFVVDMAALGQVFLEGHGISPVIIIPPVLHLLATVFGRKNIRKLGTF